MGARDKMSDTILLEKGVELLILISPVSLHGNNLLIKETFNMVMKIKKLLKHVRFNFQEIYPYKLAIIIDKTNIIFISFN
jgi:hypothetical protein